MVERSSVPLSVRTVVVDDISIRADGDGKTVTAYAAVFNTHADIHDQQGHYDELIHPTAFSKTVKERAGLIGAMFNHGKLFGGEPSERGAIAIGRPLEIRPDSRGLLTVTRFNDTALAGDLLASIRNGDPMGLSFAGRFLKSERTPRVGRGGLDLVVRKEIAMREYSFTPNPAYVETSIVGVRGSDDEDLEELWQSASARRRRLTGIRSRVF